MRQGLELRDAGLWPGVGKARAAWARQGFELRDAGLWPSVGKARTAWMRQELELRDAGQWPGVGKARAAWARQGVELRDAWCSQPLTPSRAFAACRIRTPRRLSTVRLLAFRYFNDSVLRIRKGVFYFGDPFSVLGTLFSRVRRFGEVTAKAAGKFPTYGNSEKPRTPHLGEAD